MNKLYAGFGRVNITPMMGIPISGYFIPRYADGVLDELEINALALACGDTKVVMLSADLIGIKQAISERFRRHIAEVCDIPFEAIYLHATHTHTGPATRKEALRNGADEKAIAGDKLVDEYIEFLYHRFADAAKMAFDDLKPAKMGFAVGKAANIAFVRRYVMKDGSIATNPGVNNPNIVRPVGDIDDRVNVLRFDQEGGKSLVLANVGNHPDVVGGCKISADWPGLTRHTFEKAVDNTRCIFFNGCQGDVNHVNVHPWPGFLNDTFNDFDDVSRGYGHAIHMGRVVAGAIMQVYDKVAFTDVDSIRFAQKILEVPSNMPKPEEVPEAIRIDELHKAGRDDELPYEGMMLTTVVAEAGRMVRLKDGPESFPMTLSALAIGNVVLAGIPGEPFNGISKGIKAAEGWDLILPTCITNGYEGYFPMMDAYEEGGYEARSSGFKAGVAELIIDESKKLMETLK